MTEIRVQTDPLRRGALGRHGRRGLVGAGLGLGRLAALARPGLVELHAPLAVLALHERELGAEGAPRAALEAGHLLGGEAVLDQLARDRRRQRLAGLGLPDHEAAAGIVTRPAREALAVLADLAPADAAGPQRRALDPDVLELLVEHVDR